MAAHQRSWLDTETFSGYLLGIRRWPAFRLICRGARGLAGCNGTRLRSLKPRVPIIAPPSWRTFTPPARPPLARPFYFDLTARRREGSSVPVYPLIERNAKSHALREKGRRRRRFLKIHSRVIEGHRSQETRAGFFPSFFFFLAESATLPVSLLPPPRPLLRALFTLSRSLAAGKTDRLDREIFWRGGFHVVHPGVSHEKRSNGTLSWESKSASPCPSLFWGEFLNQSINSSVSL